MVYGFRLVYLPPQGTAHIFSIRVYEEYVEHIRNILALLDVSSRESKNRLDQCYDTQGQLRDHVVVGYLVKVYTFEDFELARLDKTLDNMDWFRTHAEKPVIYMKGFMKSF